MKLTFILLSSIFPFLLNVFSIQVPHCKFLSRSYDILTQKRVNVFSYEYNFGKISSILFTTNSVACYITILNKTTTVDSYVEFSFPDVK